MDWLDHELDFSDQACFEEPEVVVRNTIMCEGRVIASAENAASRDAESAYAASVRNRKKQFGLDGTRDVGKFARSVRAGMHHQQHYAPVTCICYDADGNRKDCKPGCKHGA